MKILHFADLHGNDKNIKEVENNTDFMIDVAKKEKPDLIVCAGDVTDSKNTKMGSITAHVTIKQFSKMANIAPVIIVLGTDSHDGLSPLILSHIKGRYPIYVSERPEQLVFEDEKFSNLEDWKHSEINYPDCIISTLPTPSKKFFHTDSSIEGSNQEIGHNLGVLLAGFGAMNSMYETDNCYKIFMAHINVAGAKISETQVMIGRDIEITKDQLISTNSNVCLGGHIHKPQEIVLTDDLSFFYPGSVIRKTFAEPEDKGFYIHEQGKESRFIVLPAIRRDVCDFDFTKPSSVIPDENEPFERDFNNEITEIFEGIEFLDTNVEFKIRYKIWQDDAIKINASKIKEFFKFKGALDCKLEPNVIPREIVRNNEVNEVESVAEKIEVLAKHDNRTVEQSILDRISDLESGSSYQELIDKYSIGKENVEKEDIHPLILKMLCDKSEDCPEGNMKTEIVYFGKTCRVSCDKKCNLAWGHNGLEYDKEENPIIPKGNAPEDPGTYEGGEAKPTGIFHKHNKWCVRECERSTITDL